MGNQEVKDSNICSIIQDPRVQQMLFRLSTIPGTGEAANLSTVARRLAQNRNLDNPTEREDVIKELENYTQAQVGD